MLGIWCRGYQCVYKVRHVYVLLDGRALAYHLICLCLEWYCYHFVTMLNQLPFSVIYSYIGTKGWNGWMYLESLGIYMRLCC